MSDQEKLVAYDQFVNAFTHQWGDGRWSWWNKTPSCGVGRATREEAVADLLAYIAKQPMKRAKIELPVTAALETALPRGETDA